MTNLEVVAFGKEDLSDVSLLVANKNFKVHKLVLTHQSDYFHTLFYGNFAERNQDKIELAFQRLLTFIYDGDFGDESFIKCPSKLADPTKAVIDCFALYELMDRFDVKRGRQHFIDV